MGKHGTHQTPSQSRSRMGNNRIHRLLRRRGSDSGRTSPDAAGGFHRDNWFPANNATEPRSKFPEFMWPARSPLHADCSAENGAQSRFLRRILLLAASSWSALAKAATELSESL